MRKLLLALMVLSQFSFADWGDVYYCQMTNSSAISLAGEKFNYKPEKFMFRMDETKQAMVFGGVGYFKNSEMKLLTGESWPEIEKWRFSDEYALGFFADGKFLYSHVSVLGVSSKSADCEKF